VGMIAPSPGRARVFKIKPRKEDSTAGGIPLQPHSTLTKVDDVEIDLNQGRMRPDGAMVYRRHTDPSSQEA
jgi:hypothetical protein